MVLSLSIHSLVLLKGRHALYLVLWKIEVGVSHSLSHSQQYKKLFTFQLALSVQISGHIFLLVLILQKQNAHCGTQKNRLTETVLFITHNMF